MKKDPYSILGIERGASDDDVKSAYKKLAKKYHPDVNKEKGSEDKFKEVSAAYKSIMDGTADTPSQPNFTKTQNDIFEHFRRQAERARHQSINPNLEIEIRIEFLDACYGAEKQVRYSFMETCHSCDSYKQKHGDYKYKTCQNCHGTGRMQFVNGPMVVQTTCSSCIASGKVVDCDVCYGSFYHKKEAELSVKIPVGIEHGAVLRAGGRGNSSGTKGKFGDLYIHILINPHPEFERERLNIYSSIEVDYLDCILGNTIKATTIHGLTDVEIPECSNFNSVICSKGNGINKQGDHYFRLSVKLPKTIDQKERKILRNLNRYKKSKNN